MDKRQSIFLEAEWRKLAIANYNIDPEILKPYLPFGTELDFWNGQCIVSLVGFMFVNTKVKGFPIPFHQNFEEVNLRFYVKQFDGKEWKRGVCFIKEIVPLPCITLVANTIYKEKYITKSIKHHWILNQKNIVIEYLWKNKDHWNSFKVEADNRLHPLESSPEAEFITEHYWGFTKIDDFKTSIYEVEHPRWEIYKINNYEIKVNFESEYGKDFRFLNESIPISVMLAEGSPIKVRSKNN